MTKEEFIKLATELLSIDVQMDWENLRIDVSLLVDNQVTKTASFWLEDD